MQSFDVMVLGAGIVGASTALYLRRAGMDVALVDRQHPGQEASFGNAGIVQRNGFQPHGLPKGGGALLQMAFDPGGPVTFDVGTVVRMLPWLRQFAKAGGRAGTKTYCDTIAPLRALAVNAHEELAALSNAGRFYRKGGWLHLFRSDASYQGAELERYYARIHGVTYEDLDENALAAMEPGLSTRGGRALYWPESMSVSNPGAVVDAFWRGFIHDGGRFFRADANRIARHRRGWVLDGERGELAARQVVVCLGAWSADLLKRLGEAYPLAAKRGYHMHFRPDSGASLSRPVVDVENGFALTPTEFGIRLTTGVELRARDAPPDPAIVEGVRRRAQTLFPLGRALDERPWVGSRPCLPDSLPVIGASPLTRNLWVNFGHGHDGFTLGPVSGRLLCELLTGGSPCVDPGGVSPRRFLSS